MKYEGVYWSPAPNSWLLGQFKPSTILPSAPATAPTPWTGAIYGGFRGVLKSYFPTECVPNPTDSKVTQAIAAYTTFKTKLAFTTDAASNVDDCTNTLSADFGEDKNFQGPFYFGWSVQTVTPEFGMTTFYADSGTCFNVHVPTAHSVFEPAAYRNCVTENYITNYRLPGINGAQP